MTSGGSRPPAGSSGDGRLLTGLFLLYLAGIFLGRTIALSHPSLVTAGLIAAALGAAVAIAGGRRAAALIAISLVFLLAGLQRPLGFSPPDAPLHIRNLVGDERELSFIGKVDEMTGNSIEHQRIRMTLEAVVDGNRLLPAGGRVQLSRPQADVDRNRPILPGDRFLARARLRTIPNAGNPAGANFSLFLARDDIWVTGWIAGQGYLAALPAIDDGRQSFPLERLREIIGRRIDGALAANPQQAAMYRALVLGDRSGLAPEISETFRQSGLTHLLAISGLHLGMLGFFAFGCGYWLLRRSSHLMLTLPWPVWKPALVFSFAAIGGYALIAGMKPPVCRSLLMAGFITIALLGNRRWGLLNALVCAAFVIVILEPNSLTDLSFQLTFGAMAGLAVFLPEITRHATLPGLPRLAARTADGLLVSLAAMAGTLPILLYHFNRFSPYSPLSTLLISPILGIWVLPLGLFACLLLPIPAASALLFKAGGAPLPVILAIADFFAGLPASSLWTPSPPPWAIALYAAGLAGGLLITGHRRLRAVIIAATLLTLPLAILFHGPKDPPTTEITYLSVGAGAAAIVEMPGDIRILIDGGGYRRTAGDPGREIIAPALWRKRIRRLTGIVVTHPDADHYNGLEFIVDHFHPAWLWASGREGHPAYQRLLARAAAAGTRVTTPEQGDILATGGDGTLRVLARGDAPPPSTNDNGLVVQVATAGGKALFPGDLSRQAQERLLEAGIPVASDVFLLPHHGREDSRSATFLAAVAPRLAVVSTGDRQLRTELAPLLPCAVFSTAEHGAIVVRLNEKGLLAEPCCRPFSE
ncbi:MAG: DNA internalization-related competence protein ComEC/Rec2 [Thermodesulfobacteriota bacterium]